MQTHCQHRHIHFIDDMDSGALVVQLSLTNNTFVHCLSQRIPCAKVFPHTGKTDNLNLRLMLCHSIVERNLLHGIVLVKQILIVCKIHHLMSFIHHITQFISKHTTIPECSLCNILFCHVRCRFLPEGPYLSYMVCTLWDDITVFLTGISRFNAHQHQICLALVCLL